MQEGRYSVNWVKYFPQIILNVHETLSQGWFIVETFRLLFQTQHFFFLSTHFYLATKYFPSPINFSTLFSIIKQAENTNKKNEIYTSTQINYYRNQSQSLLISTTKKIKKIWMCMCYAQNLHAIYKTNILYIAKALQPIYRQAYEML
jgi:hypothetical protein